jgi:hypothetical protein
MKWNDWLALVNYFEHEYEEGEISETTFQHMTDRLMSFKEFAMDDYDKRVIGQFLCLCKDHYWDTLMPNRDAILQHLAAIKKLMEEE